MSSGKVALFTALAGSVVAFKWLRFLRHHGTRAVTLDFCQRLPKVELHAHINGSIRASTLEELVMSATQSTQTVDGGGPDEEDDKERRQKMLETLRLRAHDQRSLSECFAIFDVIHSVVRDLPTVTRIAREVVEDFAADGCVYLELRSTPRRDLMGDLGGGHR